MLNIAKSIAVIAAVGVVAFKVTSAAWSDSAHSTGNTFQAGTLDLRVANTGESYGNSTTLTWVGEGMVPGGEPVDAILNLKNSGTVASDHVHFAVENQLTDAEAQMDAYLEITTLLYDGVEILDQVSDDVEDGGNGNGYQDVDDWENQLAGFIGASTGDQKNVLADFGVEHTLQLAVQLHPDAPDDVQGDGVEMVLTATLHQADGQ